MVVCARTGAESEAVETAAETAGAASGLCFGGVPSNLGFLRGFDWVEVGLMEVDEDLSRGRRLGRFVSFSLSWSFPLSFSFSLSLSLSLDLADFVGSFRSVSTASSFFLRDRRARVWVSAGGCDSCSS